MYSLSHVLISLQGKDTEGNLIRKAPRKLTMITKVEKYCFKLKMLREAPSWRATGIWTISNWRGWSDASEFYYGWNAFYPERLSVTRNKRKIGPSYTMNVRWLLRTFLNNTGGISFCLESFRKGPVGSKPGLLGVVSPRGWLRKEPSNQYFKTRDPCFTTHSPRFRRLATLEYGVCIR